MQNVNEMPFWQLKLPDLPYCGLHLAVKVGATVTLWGYHKSKQSERDFYVRDYDGRWIWVSDSTGYDAQDMEAIAMATRTIDAFIKENQLT